MNGNPFFPSFCVFFLFEVWIELTCHSVGRVCKGETGERQSHMCSHHYSAGEKLSLSLLHYQGHGRGPDVVHVAECGDVLPWEYFSHSWHGPPALTWSHHELQGFSAPGILSCSCLGRGRPGQMFLKYSQEKINEDIEKAPPKQDFSEYLENMNGSSVSSLIYLYLFMRNGFNLVSAKNPIK